MSLRAAIQAVTKAAFRAVGDIAVSATYHQLAGAGTYDPTTGVSTPTWNDVEGVPAIASNYRVAEALGVERMTQQFDVQANDATMMVAAADLPEIQCKAGDRLEIADDQPAFVGTWEIVHVVADAAMAMWRLQVRQP